MVQNFFDEHSFNGTRGIVILTDDQYNVFKKITEPIVLNGLLSDMIKRMLEMLNSLIHSTNELLGYLLIRDNWSVSNEAFLVFGGETYSNLTQPYLLYGVES